VNNQAATTRAPLFIALLSKIGTKQTVNFVH